MKNEALVIEWLDYAKMDFGTAVYLHKNMIPEPLEIVCYHCQQYAEKILKALLIGLDMPLSKTHDLGMLADKIAEVISVPDSVLDACDNLSPYGVKVRYPRELFVEEQHVRQAIEDMELVSKWAEPALRELLAK